MGPLDLILRLRTQSFDSPLNKSRDNLGRFTAGLKNIDTKKVDNLGSAFSGLATKIAATFAAIKAGTAVFNGLGKAVNLAADMESTNVAFRTMIGNADKAINFISKIKKLGAETPFDFPELADAGRKLIAFGEDAETVPDSLRRIGDVASAVQAPISEIAEIYGKARVQGTLFAEDINQLTGRGIPVIQQFARILRISEGEVKNLASEGKVTFPLLEQSFRNLTAAGGQFHGMMAQQSGTTKGLMSTLKDTVNEVFTALGTPINDALKPILQDAIGLAGQLSSVAASLGQAIAPALQGMRDFVVSAGDGGNLIPMLGAKLKEAFMGLADIAMIPVRVMMEGLKPFGSALLSALLPMLDWVGNKMASIATKFAALLTNAIGDVLGTIPFMEEAGLKLKDKAIKLFDSTSQTDRAAEVSRSNIMPGLEQAGKELTEAVGNIKEKLNKELTRLQNNQADKTDSAQRKKEQDEAARKVREGNPRIIDSAEGPFAETFESQIMDQSYDWKRNPGNRKRPAPGWLFPNAQATAPAAPTSTPAAGEPAKKTPTGTPSQMDQIKQAANQAFAMPASESGDGGDERYDADGRRRSDGRKQIVSKRDGSTKAPMKRTGGLNEHYQKQKEKAAGIGPGFKTPSPKVASPGTAKAQDQRREAAASSSRNDRARWDVVQKIEQHLGKIAVA